MFETFLTLFKTLKKTGNNFYYFSLNMVDMGAYLFFENLIRYFYYYIILVMLCVKDYVRWVSIINALIENV